MLLHRGCHSMGNGYLYPCNRSLAKTHLSLGWRQSLVWRQLRHRVFKHSPCRAAILSFSIKSWEGECSISEVTLHFFLTFPWVLPFLGICVKGNNEQKLLLHLNNILSLNHHRQQLHSLKSLFHPDKFQVAIPFSCITKQRTCFSALPSIIWKPAILSAAEWSGCRCIKEVPVKHAPWLLLNSSPNKSSGMYFINNSV